MAAPRTEVSGDGDRARDRSVGEVGRSAVGIVLGVGRDILGLVGGGRVREVGAAGNRGVGGGDGFSGIGIGGQRACGDGPGVVDRMDGCREKVPSVPWKTALVSALSNALGDPTGLAASGRLPAARPA